MVDVSYQHYGILVFPQGAWFEKDIEALRTKIGQAHIEDLYRTNLQQILTFAINLKTSLMISRVTMMG